MGSSGPRPIASQISNGSFTPLATNLEMMGHPSDTTRAQMSAMGSSGPRPIASQATSPVGIIATQASFVSAPTTIEVAFLHASQVNASEHIIAECGVEIAWPTQQSFGGSFPA